jgi:hypothetical protein
MAVRFAAKAEAPDRNRPLKRSASDGIRLAKYRGATSRRLPRRHGVSTRDTGPQHAAACERIFDDHASGAKSDRPGVAAALPYLRAGDTLIVWKLDRLGRSMRRAASAITSVGRSVRSCRSGPDFLSSASNFSKCRSNRIRDTKADKRNCTYRGLASHGSAAPICTPIEVWRAHPAAGGHRAVHRVEVAPGRGIAVKMRTIPATVTAFVLTVTVVEPAIATPITVVDAAVIVIVKAVVGKIATDVSATTGGIICGTRCQRNSGQRC